MTQQTPKLEELIEEIDALLSNVEFLHGVPVSMQTKDKEKIKTFIKKVYEVGKSDKGIIKKAFRSKLGDYRPKKGDFLRKNKKIQGGCLCIKGTRVPVMAIIYCLEQKVRTNIIASKYFPQLSLWQIEYAIEEYYKFWQFNDQRKI